MGSIVQQMEATETMCVELDFEQVPWVLDVWLLTSQPSLVAPSTKTQRHSVEVIQPGFLFTPVLQQARWHAQSLFYACMSMWVQARYLMPVQGRLVENPTAEMPVSFGNSQESAVQKADYQVKVKGCHLLPLAATQHLADSILTQ